MVKSRLRTSSLALLAVALPAFADRLAIGSATGSAWNGPFFAAVSATASDGACHTELVSGAKVTRMDAATQVVELPFNYVGGAACPPRVLIFARGFGVKLIENAAFTPAGNDVVRVALTPAARIFVKAWLLTCRDERGESCTKTAKNGFVEDDAADDGSYAQWVFNESMTGLIIETAIEDQRGHGAAERIESIIRASMREEGERDITCEDFAAQLPAELADKKAINVYYTSVGVLKAKTCNAGPGGFVLMPVGAAPDVLSHELGHMLGLEHPDDDAPAQIMQPGASLERCNFTLAEVVTMHRQPPFNLAGTVPQGSISPGTVLKLYSPICPQFTQARLLDWIRCLHCPFEKPPTDIDYYSSSMLEIIPDIGAFLAGQLRLQDRKRITEMANEVANALKARFKTLPATVGQAYREHLVDQYRVRAAAALGSFARNLEPPEWVKGRSAAAQAAMQQQTRAAAIQELEIALGLHPEFVVDRLAGVARQVACDELKALKPESQCSGQ